MSKEDPRIMNKTTNSGVLLFFCSDFQPLKKRCRLLLGIVLLIRGSHIANFNGNVYILTAATSTQSISLKQGTTSHQII